jgi:hypothetical protein
MGLANDAGPCHFRRETCDIPSLAEMLQPDQGEEYRRRWIIGRGRLASLLDWNVPSMFCVDVVVLLAYCGHCEKPGRLMSYDGLDKKIILVEGHAGFIEAFLLFLFEIGLQFD